MTVATDISKVSFAGDDVTVAFPLGATFFFYDDTDLVVYLEDTSTGALTTQTITTDYTVSGGGGSTGTVTMVTAPTSSQKLWVQRVLPLTQLTDLQNNGLQDADIVELVSDKLTAIAQQLDDNLNLSLRAPISEDGGDTFILPSKSERAGKYLAFEDTADADPVARTPEQVVLGPALAAIQPLSPSAGKLIEYTGGTTAQLIDTASAGGGLFEAGAQSLGTKTNVDWSIPAATSRIIIPLAGISLTSGTADILIRLSVASTFVALGYTSRATYMDSSSNATAVSTSGFIIRSQSTAADLSGVLILHHLGSNVWTCNGHGGQGAPGSGGGWTTGGVVSLLGACDGIRILASASTFSAGAARAMYESGVSV